jgi:hypothetical protein
MLQMAEETAEELTDKNSTAISAVRTAHTGLLAESTHPGKMTITCVPSDDARVGYADRKALLREITTFIRTFPKGVSEGYRKTRKEDWTTEDEPQGKHTSTIKGWHNDEGLFMIVKGPITDTKHEVKTEYWYQELPADDRPARLGEIVWQLDPPRTYRRGGHSSPRHDDQRSSCKSTRGPLHAYHMISLHLVRLPLMYHSLLSVSPITGVDCFHLSHIGQYLL